MQGKKTIIHMGANPWQTANIDPGEEGLLIKEIVATNNKDHGLEVLTYPSINRQRLTDILLSITNPFIPHILHMTIPGCEKGGLKMGIPVELSDYENDSEAVSYDSIQKSKFCEMLGILLSNSQKLDCILLNASHSLFQAEILLQRSNHIICWEGDVQPIDTHTFTSAFYTNYKNSGSVKEAFEKGKQLLLVEKRSNMPTLLPDLRKSSPQKREQLRKERREKIEAIRLFNYTQQVQEFYKFRTKKCSLCLIHAPDGQYGQDWLFARLLQLKDIENEKFFKLERPPEVIRLGKMISSMEDLMRRFKHSFFLSSEKPEFLIEEFAEKIRVILKNNSLIIRLENLSHAAPEVIETFINNFWRPLEEKLAYISQIEEIDNYCLLFLYEEQLVNNALMEHLDSEKDILLEEISPFDLDTFNKWENDISQYWKVKQKYSGLSQEEKLAFMQASQSSNAQSNTFLPYNFLAHLCFHNRLKYTDFVKS